MARGLRELEQIKDQVGVPVVSDVHEVAEVEQAARVLDMIQIPAFLCRQTELIEAAARTGKPVHLKKGQFLDPASMMRGVDKARGAGATGVIVTERGTTFGYGDLVVDFRGIELMKQFECPVFFDATHSVQRPGGRVTGGQREYIPVLGRCAAAAGVDGIFIETHPEPGRAQSDRESQWPLAELKGLLQSFIKVRQSLPMSDLWGHDPRESTHSSGSHGAIPVDSAASPSGDARCWRPRGAPFFRSRTVSARSSSGRFSSCSRSRDRC